MIQFLVYALVLLWSVGRYDSLLSWGVSASSPIWTCITFSFVHQNIIHLITNIIALWLFYKPLRHINKYALWAAIILIPAVAVFIQRACGLLSGVTIGASAMAFTLVGFFTAEYDIKRKAYYYTSVAVSLLFPFLLPNINAWVHIFAFALGFIYAKVYWLFFWYRHLRG